MPIQIETERLLLRALREEDVETLAHLWADPDVTRYMGGPRDFDWVCAALREDIGADPPDPYDLWPVAEKSTGAVIGHCGLLEKDVNGQMEYDLTYVMAKAVWGRGYATEIAAAIKHYGFAQLGLKRIVAVIDPENRASIRVAEKVGLHYWQDSLRSDGVTRQIYMIPAPAA